MAREGKRRFSCRKLVVATLVALMATVGWSSMLLAAENVQAEMAEDHPSDQGRHRDGDSESKGPHATERLPALPATHRYGDGSAELRRAQSDRDDRRYGLGQRTLRRPDVDYGHLTE